jgi:hypothetical protein
MPLKTRKICLFTAHSPLGGGGSVILRSLIENMPEISVSWNYVAERSAMGYEKGYWGHSCMGEGLKYIWPTWRMLADKSCSGIDQLVKQLLEVDCDGYWIVSHNEGLRIALDLARLQQDRPVHLTLHDDWAGALCARSSRFRLMAGLAQKLTITAIKQVSSFDVISRGMRTFYQSISGREGQLCHRYLSADMVGTSGEVDDRESSRVNIGHIGSIYDKRDFLDFLTILQEFGQLKGKEFVLHMWGCHLGVNDIPADLRATVRLHTALPEHQVLPELARCAFVYSMYPMSDRLRCFSRTSLPTKLTSYVQAGRPIFGHGPSDSTLAEFLRTTNTGLFWSGRNRDEGMQALAKVLALRPSSQQWQDAREQYFGEENLATIRRVLLTPNRGLISSQL